MTLLVPRHIVDSGLMTQRQAFKWDEPWDCKYEAPRLENDLNALYSRAVMAFAAATAEWVIWPLSQGRDRLFLDFVEACWAAAVDRRYLRSMSRIYAPRIRQHYKISPKVGTTEDLWNPGELADPVRGPQFVAIHLLELVADSTAPDDSGTEEAAYLSNLVEQVTNKNKAFKQWRRTVVDQLQDHYGLTEDDEDNLLGPPVPREALSTDAAFKPAQGPALVKAFLNGLDPAKNRFLAPASEMKKLGFEGLPYDL